jgi:hypothetical protein
MCEYGRKSTVIGEKILISKRGQLKLRLRGGKKCDFFETRMQKVAYFAWIS